MTRQYAAFMYRPCLTADTEDEWHPPAWNPWNRLCKLAPELRQLSASNSVNQQPPPRSIDNETLLAFAACFADPVKRKILATLVLDAIGDDLVELIQAALKAKESACLT